MWRRWRAEFERTRRESDLRHAEWLRQFEKECRASDRRHDDRVRESDRRHADWQAKHAAFLADQKRRFDRIDAAMENDKRVTREMILELREGREHDRDMRDEMRAQREGLLRVLDEFRRNDGPSAAGA
jgi:hypothetical protein